MTTILMLGCVKTKVALRSDQALPAQDLYASPLWRGRRRYAEARGLPWMILSAKHGLILPTQEIALYDTKISEVLPLREGLTKWHLITSKVLRSLSPAQPDPASPIICEIHAGAAYALRFREAASLARCAVKILLPVAGLSLGMQLRYYSAAGDAHND